MNLKEYGKRFLLSAVSAAMVISAAAYLPEMQADAAQTSTISNPVIWADVPDVDVIRVGDTYYMVSTTMYFSPGAPIMKSKDLVSWEICNYVYNTYADGDVQNLTNGKHDYAHGQWATSLRYHDGVYYVFFGSYGSGKSYIYKTTDIENGTWTRSELSGMYHDASLFFDDDGRNYLIYGGGGNIEIKELNAEMTGFKEGGAAKRLFSTGLDNLAGEGAHVHKIGDYYYVFIIAWPSTSGRIELCYRSKDLLGTYEGRTVLNSGVGSYGSGVAQGGIVDTPDGKWYGMLFQDHGSVGRIPVLVPVTWEDGWPMMGVNGKAPITLTVDGASTGTSLAKDDDFSYASNDELALEWQWNHNPDNSAWSVTERDGYLRLTNKTLATNLLNARNTLTMRTEGPACSSAIRLDTKGMKIGDHAGLSAFQFKYGNVGVYVADDGSKKIYMANNGGYSGSSAVTDSRDNIVEQVNLTGDTVWLKADFLFNTIKEDGSSSNNIDKVNFYYSYDGTSWTKIGEELGMVYDLKLFTGYRSAIYSYATKTTGGYADIDAFDYERTPWNAPTIIEPDANGWYFHSTFEGDLDEWTGRGAASVMTSGRTAYDGKEALLVQERTAAWNGACRTLNPAAFKPGEAYSFSADVQYFDGSAHDTFYMKLQYTDANGDTQYSTIAEASAVKGEWVQLANTKYTIPADAENMQLYIETADSTNNFYIDEAIGAVAGTEIDGPKPIPFMRGDVTCDGVIDAFDLAAAKRGLLKGYANSTAKLAADVDESGTAEVVDLVQLVEFVMGGRDAFTIAEKPEEPTQPADDFVYDANLQYKPAPDNYLTDCSQAGKVINETYEGINGTNKLNVYLPYNYDPSKQYNILYLMHGGGENENTIFSDDVKLDHMLDHMIMNGDIEPMIVVTPTFNKCEAATFYKELRQSVIPFVEGKYSTYAKSTSEADLIASRMHRAYGGFSMGSLSAWCVGNHSLDMVGYLMPLSGDNWEGVSSLTKEIDRLGLQKDEYFIMCATGTKDIAYENMNPQMEAMKNDSHFTYTSDFSKGNFYYLTANDATHWWGFVRHYVYDCLPYFFHHE